MSEIIEIFENLKIEYNNSKKSNINDNIKSNINDNTTDNIKSNINDNTKDNIKSNINDNNKVIINKGTGAGGKNTNINGKSFENITNIENILFNNKFEKIVLEKSKYSYYLYKNIDNKKIIYLLQNGLKLFMKKNFNINLFRCPDEAYIIQINDKYIMKILEKKAQHVDGYVDLKLWSGPSLKREYEIILGKKFTVEYAFCVNKFLQDKINSNIDKYKILNQILNESNINIFYGEDDNYFDKIYKWINNF